MRTKLKNKREELGFTQDELAKAVSIARTTYTNIELGLKNPSFEVAIKIKRALNYLNDDIFLNINVPNRDLN